LLEQVFRRLREKGRERVALVSTCGGTYHGVSDRATLGRLARRVDRIVITTHEALSEAVELAFEARGCAR